MKEISEIIASLFYAQPVPKALSFISFISAGLIKLSAELKNITTFRVSNQRFMQLCMRKVDTKAVMTVKMKLPIFSAGMFLNNLIMMQ